MDPRWGANVGATRMNDFTRQADGYGQPGSDHASSRTNPGSAERLTGIYGCTVLVVDPEP